MKPPLSSDGTTATHSADPRISSGIRLSGAAWISSRTVPAASTRPEALVLGSGALVSSSVLAERTVVWKHVRKQSNSSRTREFRIMPLLGDQSIDSVVLNSIRCADRRIAGEIGRAHV